MRDRTLIIAEAGVNHNGDICIAKQLIDAAADAGADIVKFQTFKAENLVIQAAQKAEYQLQTTSKEESQFQMLKKLELSFEDHKDLIKYAKEKNIGFLSTPFDLDSLQLLIDVGIDTIKLPSGEITNYPLLKKSAETGKRIILSTGMSDLKEIIAAVKVLKDNGAGEIILLHCNTQYPTLFEDVNLNAMKTIAEATGLPVGYSDHTNGIEVPIAAVALGATVIEKHFTLDRNMEGPDHKASLEPLELKAMVSAIRNIEKAMGDGVKQPSYSERENIKIVRKSIIASCDIQKGDIFTEMNITTKRPGTGMNPMRWQALLGTLAKKDYKMDDLIDE